MVKRGKQGREREEETWREWWDENGGGQITNVMKLPHRVDHTVKKTGRFGTRKPQCHESKENFLFLKGHRLFNCCNYFLIWFES